MPMNDAKNYPDDVPELLKLMATELGFKCALGCLSGLSHNMTLLLPSKY